MLTARGEVADRVLGLELGADDYLPKPFEPARAGGAHPIRAAPRGRERWPRTGCAMARLELDFRRREAALSAASPSTSPPWNSKCWPCSRAARAR